MNLRPFLACNWGQYFTFPASDVWSEKIHTLARKATLTRLPRKIRLPHRLLLATYLRARFKHFLISYDESETTYSMQFVAILYTSGLRFTIQKSDFLNSKPTLASFWILVPQPLFFLCRTITIIYVFIIRVNSINTVRQGGEANRQTSRLASTRADYAPRQPPGSGVHSKVPTAPGSGGPS